MSYFTKSVNNLFETEEFWGFQCPAQTIYGYVVRRLPGDVVWVRTLSKESAQ